MSTEPTAACGTCGGRPRLNAFDRDGTADIIGGWCAQCGRLGPMRAEVQDACAAWDADQARPCERLEVAVWRGGTTRVLMTEEDMAHLGIEWGDRVLIVRKGATEAKIGEKDASR